MVGLSPVDFVFDGDPAPTLKGAEPHPICGPRLLWIKLPLCTEVDLGLRDIVFDVDPATPGKRHTRPHPIFGLCLLWPNGWMDQDATW